MKQLLLTLFISLGVIGLLKAQDFTTPNNGMVYSLDDLLAASPTTLSVSGNIYSLIGNLTISSTDTLLIDSDLTLEIGANILITIFGTFTVDADTVMFTAIDVATPYDGFRFEEFSTVNIQNSTIQYGGGLRVLTETFTINNSTITNNVSGVSTGSVISLSRGEAQITNNTITFNETPAISSGANNQVSAYIFNNYIEGNNSSNNNRPQINMGATLSDPPLRIIGNTIRGDRNNIMAGGIAVANLVGGSINAVIDDNIITDNRYGITVIGPSSFAYIRNNVIEDNDTQGDPNLGGSGISLSNGSNSMEVIASGNQFRRNLWGITLLSGASINLGDGGSNAGHNVFSENGNGGTTYALYNNTSNSIMAMNNCWDEMNLPNTLASAEDVIVHQNDINTLGLVTFDPVNCDFLSVDDLYLDDVALYPNPSYGTFTLSNNVYFEQMNIYSLDGKFVAKRLLHIGSNEMHFDLSSGLYIIELVGPDERSIKKLVIQ
ncbi:MAG: T9SS type A sorting domain-containing protein [Aquaticitalea sp.]